MVKYKVGYRKPPEEKRWKKGQSGNPKGRPRKAADPVSIDDAEIVARLDNEIVEIGEKRMKRRSAEIRIIFEMAIRRDRKAMRLMDRLRQKTVPCSGGGVIHRPLEYFLEDEQ